ncbi:hypothetical protein LINGRAHAP2_LOCUS25953 [Linum grandiflorum]
MASHHSMQIAKSTSMAFVGLIITITTCYASYHRYESHVVVATSAQSDGFRCFWNDRNFKEAPRGHDLKYCTDVFKKVLEQGDSLDRDDFVDTLITCPDYRSPPDLYTMVHCRDRNDCKKCLKDAASLIGQYCDDCYGFRALSGDCRVRYETYNFTSFD